ncbi:hypothetical protein AB0K43_26200 [Kitasatospora sp. NPDC049258]|uniref:hypothetical protein n=1 Tax=Kitasatospora sp. NPDC049258 TaxID=3155394 RepID=UPI0034397CB6
MFTPAAPPYGRNLFEAIWQRHCRQPFANRDVPETGLGELTADAERRTGPDLARMAGTRAWLRLEEPAADGIPAAALGPQDHDALEALPQLATLTTHPARHRSKEVRHGRHV